MYTMYNLEKCIYIKPSLQNWKQMRIEARFKWKRTSSPLSTCIWKQPKWLLLSVYELGQKCGYIEHVERRLEKHCKWWGSNPEDSRKKWERQCEKRERKQKGRAKQERRNQPKEKACNCCHGHRIKHCLWKTTVVTTWFRCCRSAESQPPPARVPLLHPQISPRASDLSWIVCAASKSYQSSHIRKNYNTPICPT